MIDRHKILQPDEIALVLDYMLSKQHTKNGQVNLIIFRLSCCYGLRAGELVGLNIGDIVPFGPFPQIKVRKATTKGKKSYGRARTIPLDIDGKALADIQKWYKQRVESTGGQLGEPFVCGMSEGSTLYTRGKRLTEDLVARRWKTTLKILAECRQQQLSIHKGRHTFCSHTLAAGFDLAEVKEMAGHGQISSTNEYLHSLNRPRPRDVFDFATQNASSQPRQARRSSPDSRT